jgi:hypothetical protein
MRIFSLCKQAGARSIEPDLASSFFPAVVRLGFEPLWFGMLIDITGGLHLLLGARLPLGR